MGVLGASKPWPMSPPLNPADFPGANPNPTVLPSATLVTNFFPEYQLHQEQQLQLQGLQQQSEEYVRMRRNPESGQRSMLFGKMTTYSGGQQLPLYETVRPKSAAIFEDNNGMCWKGGMISGDSPGRIENEYSMSPRTQQQQTHYRQRSDTVTRPPVPPPLPPNRPSSVHGMEMINRNEFSGALQPPATPTCAPWLKKFKVMKKIKRKIGIGSGTKAGTCFNNLPALKFHGVHGENVQIFQDGTTARRINSFCKAIVFTDRPVKVNEKVCIRLIEVSNNWSGVVRFGFTNRDPTSLKNSLPKYVCPDLTSRSGVWAKAFSDPLVKKNIVLEFHVNSSGEIHFGIDGEDKGIFLTGVDTRTPLWSVMDIYGNTTAVELVDSRAHLNNSRPSLNSVESIPLKQLSHQEMPSCRSSRFTPQAQSTSVLQYPSSSSSQATSCSAAAASQQYHRSISMGASCASPARSLPVDSQTYSSTSGPSSRCYGGEPQKSSGATLSSSYLPVSHLVKSQVRESMCRGGAGVVSTSSPNNAPSSGAISCSAQYPSSSSQLPAYKSPPVPSSAACRSDYEIVYPSKTMMMSVNPGPSNTSNYVSIPSLSKGQTAESEMQKVTANMSKVSLNTSTSSDGSSPSKENPVFSLECLACCERPVDSVFYSCGHMCMCFQCANAYLETKEKGYCPICRAVISDVIRTYT